MGVFKRRYARYFIAAFVMLVTVAVYLPALQGEFMALWDDDQYVYENEHIRSLDIAFFKWAFLKLNVYNWHPLTWVSHAVDYAIWGPNPLGHHLTSIVFHSVNSFLVVLLAVMLMNIYRTKKTKRKAPEVLPDDSGVLIAGAVTGLTFGLHPVHVESVAWVAERKDVLCAFFFLLSILAYLRYASAELRRQKRVLYLLSIMFFTFALLSKPMAVSLPVVLLVLDVYPLGRLKQGHFNRDVFMEKAPFFILSVLSSVLTVLAQKYGGAISSLEVYPFWARCWIGVRGGAFYLFKMIWPANLAPFYPYPAKDALFSIEFFASVFVVAAVTFFCIISWRRQKIYLTVLAYYIVTLLPVSGIIQVGGQAVADRYSYLPSLGPTFLVGLAASRFWGETDRGSSLFTLRRYSVIVSSVLVFLVLSVITIKQTAIWHDALSLWNAELKVFPENPRAISKLGEIYFQAGDFNKAIGQFDKVLEINPFSQKAYYKRGLTFLMLGKSHQAIEDFNRAIELNPNDRHAFNDRMMAYKLAVREATSVISANPQNAASYFNRGLTYELMGDYSNAVKDYDKTLALRPRDAEAFFHRAITYKKSGDYDQAKRDFQTAVLLGSRKAREYLQPMEISR